MKVLDKAGLKYFFGTLKAVFKTKQSAVSDPSASGSSSAFIDTISQDANGKITVTKKNVSFPGLSGGSAAADDVNVVGGVTGSGHALTVEKKTLTAGDNVTITKGKTAITIAAENTDTKVTSVGNHYTPAEDTGSEIYADAANGSAATWNSTNLVTGVNLKRDAKGHVVGISVDSVKMPANPDTDTHYTSKNTVGATNATANSQKGNGAVYLNHIENGSPTSTHKITGAGSVSVTSDTNGNITITGTDTNTDTDTKVTSVGNHYAPVADSNATLSVDASSSTSATWGTTDLVTGVNIQRDAKGHVTGVTVDSIQMPANPNVNYTLPAAGSSLGGVKSGGDVTISNGTITVNDDSHNHVISNVDGLQAALDGKAPAHSHPYLPTAGGTMTGELKTSFKSAVAMGSYQAAATTVANLVAEVRYSSGCMGSVSLSTAYTKDSVTVPTGWYNFMYAPHRSGGANGAASGDNQDYGTLLLFGMTESNRAFRIRVSGGSISELRAILENGNYGSYIASITTSEIDTMMS